MSYAHNNIIQGHSTPPCFKLKGHVYTFHIFSIKLHSIFAIQLIANKSYIRIHTLELYIEQL